MILSNLLVELAARLGNPDICLNEAGVCRLVLDGQFGISIEKTATDDGAILYSVVGQVPAADREAFYTRLLSAQLYAREIGEGCAFGLDSDTGEIVLCRKLSLGSFDAAAFYAALNEFANWAEYWTGHLGVASEPAAGSSAETSDSEYASSHFIRA
jgi:hypothetical protein